MVGDLSFNGANIEMGNNQIRDVNQIDATTVNARPAAGDGSVTADSMETDLISADDFRYTNP